MNTTTEITAPVGSSSSHASPTARRLTAGARIFLGLIFFVFGLNGFLNFIPPPSKPMPENAMGFLGGLMKAGYILPLVAGTQVLVGLFLLSNRFVPLALILIAPIIVNIVAFHLFLEPSGLPVAIVVLALELYLLFRYRVAYRPMLASKVTLG